LVEISLVVLQKHAGGRLIGKQWGEEVGKLRGKKRVCAVTLSDL